MRQGSSALQSVLLGMVSPLFALGCTTDSPDEKFLAEVHAKTEVGDVTDEQILDAGHGVCELFDEGVDLDTVARSFEVVNLPATFAGTVTGAAVRNLCPEHADLLN